MHKALVGAGTDILSLGIGATCLRCSDWSEMTHETTLIITPTQMKAKITSVSYMRYTIYQYSLFI